MKIKKEIFQWGVQSLWEWPINDWFDLLKEKKKVFWADEKQVHCVSTAGGDEARLG